MFVLKVCGAVGVGGGGISVGAGGVGVVAILVLVEFVVAWLRFRSGGVDG